ncbi:uncharacterized protein LOC133799884 [Humulus lupulus]|uniref:uncharacterized protein LOC133799884 n=1 Tax=Humulus lupulus TaxID=3486 RepID=UPI002B40DD81|nr:uncharacterized protein LOC133799884 [Humulus lupulus]
MQLKDGDKGFEHNQEQIQSDFSEWMEIIQKGKAVAKRSGTVKTPLHILRVNSRAVREQGNQGFKKLNVKIEKEDVEKEIKLWSSSLRDMVLNGGYMFFDRKPVVMKAWSADGSFTKEELYKFPIWVHMYDLHLKYWGNRALAKILSPVGEYLQQDVAKRNRDKLQYARVLIEVTIDQEFLDTVEFLNENDEITYVTLLYEWKPIRCTNCDGYGHSKEVCKKKNEVVKRWVPKAHQKNTMLPVQKAINKKDASVTSIANNKLKMSTKADPTPTKNTFQALEGMTDGRFKWDNYFVI